MKALCAWLFLAAVCVAADTETKHAEMLYPAVRVTAGEAGGSGTILYSEDRGDGCQTYILTNDHVIAGAVHIKDEWSSLLQQDVKKEVNDLVQVEIFRYADGSRQDISDTCRAEIVAHNEQHDLALLKLQTARKFDYVAKLMSDAEVRIFEPIWAVGCSLLHPPVVTEGILNYLDDVIDRKVYWMGSAQIIFGNSGGAVYLEKDGHYVFIGVPSRVAGTYNQAVTHMGWFVPVPRIREWFGDEHLQFLLDAKVTPQSCFEQRKKVQKDAERQQKAATEKRHDP
jgi:S1-C subfamily serine protease